jgi:protein-disulfide isomerase
MISEAEPPVRAVNNKGMRRMEKLSAKELLTPLAVIIAGIMITGAILWSNKQFLDAVRPVPGAQPSISESSTGAPSAPAADAAKVSQKDTPFIGNAKAPVVMAYWYDYQCPYCRDNEVKVMPRLITDYVKPGKLKILFKDFAFLGRDSQVAAEAAKAVWEVAPDKFYDWHKAMFDHQDEENAGWGTKDDIIALTKTIPGIDAAKVEQFMIDHDKDYQEKVEADGAEGNAMGITGTPGVIIGKQLIVGAQSYEQYKTAIEAGLSPAPVPTGG